MSSKVGHPSVALFDFDTWTYDIAFAAQTEKDKPSRSFDYCRDFVDLRMEEILKTIGCSTYEGYLTGTGNFRHELAETLPYKGNRKQPKPWHYENIRNYLEFKYKAKIINGIEADDILAIRATELGDSACIVSRDKDLRMVPCWHYSYPVSNQPEKPLEKIDELGYLNKNAKGKCYGGGLKWFYAQMIIGDKTDNIPGLPKGGDVLAFKTLSELETEAELFQAVRNLYIQRFGEDEAVRKLLEQGRLLWMVREFDSGGLPVMWNPPKIIEEIV